jgi:hypothetical protein
MLSVQKVRTATTSLFEATTLVRKTVVKEVAYHAPALGKKVLLVLGEVSEKLYAVSLIAEEGWQVIKGSLSRWLRLGLTGLLHFIRWLLGQGAEVVRQSSRQSWGKTILAVVVGVLMRRSQVFRFLVLVWRLYRLARRLSPRRCRLGRK